VTYGLVYFSGSFQIQKALVLETLEENRPVGEKKIRNRKFDATYGTCFLISTVGGFIDASNILVL
jgi:hypothetical protein